MKVSKKQKQKLSHLLVKAREESGMTQNQVAETGIVSQSVLSKMENGDTYFIDFIYGYSYSILSEFWVGYFCITPNYF